MSSINYLFIQIIHHIISLNVLLMYLNLQQFIFLHFSIILTIIYIIDLILLIINQYLIIISLISL